MTSASRKFGPVVACGWLLLAMLAIVSPALAQSDLNRFVPKISFGNLGDDKYEEEPAPTPPTQQPNYQHTQRGRQPQPRRQTQNNRTAAQASYQSSAARYQNPRHEPGSEDVENEPLSDEYAESNSAPQQNAPRTAMNPQNRQQHSSPKGNNATYRGPSRGRGMYENSAMSNAPQMQNNQSQNNRRPPSQNARYDHSNNEPIYEESYEQYPDAPASYESSAGNNRNGNRGQMNYGRTNNNYGRPQGGMGFGNLFGTMGIRTAQQGTPSGNGIGNWIPGNRSSAMNSPTPAMGAPVVMPEPVVTPEAVYLDVETVKVGKPIGPTSTITMPGMPSMPSSGMPIYEGSMPMDGGPMNGGPMNEGRSWLPGGPIMGRGCDGYTNPQCNDCCGGCGGSCGGAGCGGNCGGCCGGQKCGDNYGMYGGCEEGYDCCGGCGPNYCPLSGPYGRPWILAPLDFLFGGLWHCGPYCGACDPCGGWWWGQDFTVFGGVHDFRSPVNITGNSNFGFHEGVNWSMPLWHEYGLGAQIGFSTTQSNLQSNTIDIYDEYRNQTFVTAGLFHRPCDGQGLQYGVVYDYLHDDYYQKFNVAQLRGELGWLLDCRNELGFWFATGIMDSDNRHDNVFLGANEYSPIDQYAFYYRRRFCRGGEGRVWGGFTDNSGGLVGADFRVPISKGWAIETGFNYIISENNQNPVFNDETWNVGANLVWYWGGNANCRSLYRPLFNVADNGSFMVTRSGLNGQ